MVERYPWNERDMPDSRDRPIVLREIRAEDAESVAELTAQLGYERGQDQIRAWITGLSPQHEQAAFVACLDEAVIAWIEVSVERRLQSAPFAMIGGLVVSDKVRSRGIGRLLCERAEQWAWEHGLETVRVTSRSTRAGAHRFYLRHGYREAKTSLVFEKSKPEKESRP
jgi:GNAT superfamily N-acetyltransferase